jgi:hydroxyethylthiazole kinase
MSGSIMATEAKLIGQDLRRIRTERPLVHNITNYVAMNPTANALLAIGASPVMAHALEEVEEMVSLARALVINIGTLSRPWVQAMIKAGKVARRRKIPVVLDPVGCGATRYRTTVAQKLLREAAPTIVRGNASEIRSLLGRKGDTKGVESRQTPDAVLNEARALSHSAGCVVSVSGAVDLIVEGDTITQIANGHPLMARVTGMGCTASAITGAFAAVNPQSGNAAARAMAVMGIAGEMAAERSGGPGSFQMHFLDALSVIRESDIAKRLKMQND